ncbi:hypothetical protein HAX54_000669 [Datura stramonium]|uniref:Uncharacterized protein n=1 Tax=Datura stramonium TaxID=4076 RepID=A0ABS8T1B8_DATST|nr:hypothetical protein [Datura stramonium]
MNYKRISLELDVTSERSHSFNSLLQCFNVKGKELAEKITLLVYLVLRFPGAWQLFLEVGHVADSAIELHL